MHRPLIHVADVSPDPAHVATALHEITAEQADAEIVLITFVDPHGVFSDPGVFDDYVPQVRAAYTALGGPLYFMVAFHRQLARTVDTGRPLTKDTLVPLIRRTPDPVIQCVNAAVLERARVAAQQAAHRKLVEAHANDPVLRAMIERSVQTDSELSADIARTNFEAVGTGEGRDRLEARVASICEDRDRTYG